MSILDQHNGARSAVATDEPATTVAVSRLHRESATTRPAIARALTLIALAAAAACGDNDAQAIDAGASDASSADGALDAVLDAPPASATCSTSISPGQGGQYVELCSLSHGSVSHVRITGLMAPASHASAQIWFGFDSPPTTTQGPLEADQFKLMLYGGGPPSVPAMVQATFGDHDELLDGDTSFVTTISTVCFDLYRGSASAPPAFVLWIDGKNGADCEDRSTLSIASAFGVRALWRGAVGTIDTAAKMYFRQTSGVAASPHIDLFEEAVLPEATIRAAVSCSSTWVSNTDWQPTCVTAAGPARHVRIESAAATATNSYWYAVIGQDPSPTGNPAAGAGKLVVTGGKSHTGASWTWFRFDDGTTAQFTYATTAGGLYTDAPSTVCFDLGATSVGNARLVFWATGASGADCGDRTTLTTAAALYDSTTDAVSGAIWDVPYATGKANFVKVNNATVSLGAITVTSEPAAL